MASGKTGFGAGSTANLLTDSLGEHQFSYDEIKAK